jgi:succinate dehydrogenase / fumarate reductase flavoprotein subunit
MVREVLEGRGAGPHKDYVYIDVRHLGEDVLNTKLPDITEFARTYLGVEPYTEPVPVYPTAHYAMGGVPTNVETEVLRNNTEVVPGLYAAGEVACVSVHGSNRLGTNSLLDINVFGRRAGIAAAEYAANAPFVDLPANPAGLVEGMVETIRTRESGERVADLRRALQETMDRNVQVFRTEASMKEALGVIDELKERYANVVVQDKGRRYNTDLLEAVELGFLIELAEVITLGALARKESRGGHFREDYEARDDVNFMRHTMAYRAPLAGEGFGAESALFADEVRLDYKPVTVTRYQPMERKY